ncbi:MAG: substrate-binding domain-containing protein [Candidatus Ratteibacteria bacterium]
MVIAPNLRHFFYYQIISSVEKIITRNGLNIILRSANEEKIEERHCLSEALNLGVIGIILIAGKHSTFNAVIISKIPIVSVDMAVKGLKIDLVASDDRNGGFLATEHLIELGHRKILHLAAPQGDSDAEAWLQGYTEALKKYNIKIMQNLIRPTEWHFEDVYFQPNVAVTYCVPEELRNPGQIILKNMFQRLLHGIKRWQTFMYGITGYTAGNQGSMASAIFPHLLQEIYLLEQDRVRGHVIELCNKDAQGSCIIPGRTVRWTRSMFM